MTPYVIREVWNVPKKGEPQDMGRAVWVRLDASREQEFRVAKALGGTNLFSFRRSERLEPSPHRPAFFMKETLWFLATGAGNEGNGHSRPLLATLGHCGRRGCPAPGAAVP